MKIAIYIGGTPNKTIDCRNIVNNGNPGIGGTDYEFLCLTYFLYSVRNEKNIDIYVFHPNKYIIDKGINQITGVTQEHFAEKCNQLAIDVAIIDSRWNLKNIKTFNGSNTKLVLWSHCVGSYYRYLLFARWNFVSKVVFVSRGHLYNFIDNPVARKMTYAFNAVTWNKHIDSLRNNNPFVTRPKDVVFLGAVDKAKGFHILAKAWPFILRVVPEAKLHIIGSASLYGGNPQLGTLGIASKEYEDTFCKYLTDKDGKLHQSVIMHGQLAEEKYEIMANCRVGVPNPDGFTETFCISAVEMQLCGCLVVSKWSSGYIDTVPPPNILVDSEEELAAAIISALNDDSFECNPNIDNIIDNFTLEKVGNKWLEILLDVTGEKTLVETIMVPNIYNFQSRKVMASIRKVLPFFPPIGLVSDTLSRLKAKFIRK